MKAVRAISLDATGTIYRFRHKIGDIYSRKAELCGLTPISPPIMDRAFITSYKKIMKEYPVYGYHHNLSEREWWRRVVSHTFESVYLDQGLNQYSADDFEQCFRLIYQHYGSSLAYDVYPDAISFILRFQTLPLHDHDSVSPLSIHHNHTMNSASNNSENSLNNLRKVSVTTHNVILGISTNSPHRTIESTLPSLGLHNNFKFFVSCKDTGVMKPDIGMFDKVFESVRYFIPDIQRDEILHIGDDIKADYCGAKAAGFQALFLRRDLTDLNKISENMRDFKEGLVYKDKIDEDLYRDVIASFDDIDIQ
jgi:putative hydrolase of the HAD superfamily